MFHRPLVLLLAGFIWLAPIGARGQFATLLDTTSRYAGISTGTGGFNQDTGVATATELNVPSYIVFDSLGNLYISDTQNNCVRKVAPNGQISTVAGLRVSGNSTDTCNTASLPGPDPAEGLLAPTGLAVDSSNTLYIADSQHNCVRSLASGVVDNYATPALTTVAGTCTIVTTDSDTPVPMGLAVDGNSNLYISIVGSGTGVTVNQVVEHQVSASPTTICLVAGQSSTYAATTLCSGITGTNPKLDRPAGLAFDKNENLFIADSNNNCVREIAGLTTPQTAVGQCVNDLTGSTATALNNPYGLAFAANGSLYISESGSNSNNVVSFNSGSNSLTPIAGLPSGASGPYNSSQDGHSALSVPLNQPLGVTTDTGGNLYLADSQNNIVRRMGINISFPPTNVGSISISQTLLFSINQSVNLTLTVGPDYNIVSTTCSGSQASGATCQVVIDFQPTRPGYRYSALVLKDSISGKLISVELEGLGIGPLSLLTPGVASSRATGLRTAIAVSTDSAGGAYVLEQGNGSTTADVLYYPAGSGTAQVVVAQGAGMVTPTAMAVDGAGNIFIADSGVAGLGGGNIIRFGADGSVNKTYATGLPGVTAMAVDGFDDLFLAIGGSFHNLTEIYAGGQRRVIAGDGATADANNVPAVNAAFYAPSAVALGSNGIAVADAGTHYVYLIDNSGIIHIVAGNGTVSTTNAALATGTGLVLPDGLAIDAAGDIYIADDTANIVYAVYATISNGTNIFPVIGTGTVGYTGDNGPSIAATINAPLSIALDGSSDLFVIDSGNKALREVTYPFTSTISFGSVLVNTASAPILQYLANAGNATLIWTSLPFTTTDTVHYNVSGAATTCTGTTVSGGVCDIGYTFTPTVIGPAPAGQSNLPSNSYNSVQVVNFSSTGSSGFGTVPLPYTLPAETEVYGYSFSETVTLNLTFAASGSMVFTVNGQTICTTSILNASSGTVTCNAAATNLAVGHYTVNFTFTSTNSFYSSVTGTTTLNVTQAPLTVNVNSFSRMYGQPNPTFTGAVTGAVNGDTFTITYSTNATQFSPVGQYTINANVTGANIADYIVTINTGILTITQASGGSGLVVTVNSVSRPYGQPNPTFTSTISGALNGDTFTINYSTSATQFSPVGQYAINATVSGAAAANYTITVVPGTLTITQASGLVVTVNSTSRPYGQPNPTFTSTISGALNGDTFTINYSTSATQFSPVGQYAINATVSGAAAANYSNIIVVPGTLTITQATGLVVMVNSVSRPYGQPNPTFTSTVSGALNGDTFTINYSTSANQFSPVGQYAINATVSGAATANYSNIVVVPGTLFITQSTTPVVITVNNVTRPYGQPNPAFTSTVSGALNGDTFTINYSTSATQFSPVGQYAINATVSGAALANYTSVQVVSGTLTIAPAPGLVVVVNSTSRPYGTPNPTFTGTITGLLNGDTVTVTYSTTATIGSPIGAYPITATVSGPAAANYSLTVVQGTLTITPSTTPLVIAVNSVSRPYGQPNPAFTSTITGALNGDTFTINYSTPATQSSPIGVYPIAATVSGAVLANYASVTVIPGTLTITLATAPLVIAVNNTARAYGAANPTFTSTITGAAPNDTFTVTYSTTATVLSDVGSYPINATVTGANIANYATVTVVPGTLAITPLATVTTVTTSASPVTQGTSVTFTATVTYGAGLPVAAATVNFYNGTTLLCASTLNSSGVATCTTSTLPVGTLTITATYQATLDFASSSGTVAQIVNPGSFTIAATPPNQFISGPGTTVYVVTVSPVQSFAGPVALACSGLPADASCTFANPTVDLTSGGGSVTTTMTVTTTAADARLDLPMLHLPAGRTPNGLSPIAFAAVFPFGLGAFFGFSRRKRGRARASRLPKFRLLLALLCTAAIVSLAGCACLSSVSQVYTIPITGTTTVSGVSAQSASVTLTVAQE
jgi:sugar lactone lactonase YvrE